MTELDRNVLINSRRINSVKPWEQELWPFFTMGLTVEPVGHSDFICVCANGYWFVICRRLYEYVKTFSRGNV